jgi:YidC/Oxa1 family membrane protein insertase
MVNFFNVFLYQPLFNALIFLYAFLPGHDFGVAIIILTLLIRLALYPLMAQSIKSQKILNELQPKIQEIQKKYKDDKQAQAKATMELYQQEKFNPFGGCLPLLVQLPILWALYRVFWQGFGVEHFNLIYSFVPHPAVINQTFLGLVDLSQANIIFAILAGVLQYVQSKMVLPKTLKNQAVNQDQMSQMTNIMQKQMVFMMPLFTVFILWKLPAAIGLYWMATTLFSIVQQYLIYKKPITKNA